MKIANTLTGKKEEFAPMADKKVRMFVCGPTVYDLIHIGNARTFVFFDVVAKYLREKEYEVDYIQNITDIDDKIINRAREAGMEPLVWAKEYSEKFKEDMNRLGVSAVNKYAPATEHIDQVKNQVKKLIEKGHAYLIEGDGWYFDIKTFPEYGKLSGRTAQMADDAVSRIDESDKKRNAGDFALWKLSKPKSVKDEIAEPSWPDEELGAGRPGWHIEDTAITEHYFGPQYDLHGGGADLIFPHHEAEITQQESASGLSPFVKYWMHVAFLVNKGGKMSKSQGNFSTVRETLEEHEPEVLRFYLLSNHYRTPLDYSDNSLVTAAAAVQRIYEAVNKLNNLDFAQDNPESQALANQVEAKISELEDAMDDDFNTPKAFAVVFDAIKLLNTNLTDNKLGSASADAFKSFFSKVSRIFGVIPPRLFILPVEIQALVDKRESFRAEKNWEESDKIRAQLSELGYAVEDTIHGPLVKKSRS